MHTKRSPGFALVLVLFALAVAATSLSVTARRCLVVEMRSHSELQHLQRRWERRSCEELLLSKAEQLLSAEEHRLQAPTAAIAVSAELAGHTCRILLCDEQSKINVNWVAALARRNPDERILALLDPSRQPPSVRLSPLKGTEAGSFPSYGCFEQLFPEAGPMDIVGTPDEPGLGSILTCWGDGRLNARRTSLPTLRGACGMILTRAETERVARHREGQPQSSAADLIRAAQAPAERAELLRGLLTDVSACYGLWIVQDEPASAELAVIELPKQNEGGGKPSLPRVFRFFW